MYDYYVQFTNELGNEIHGEYKIRGVRGQEEALIKERERLLRDKVGSMNLPGFCRDVTVKITRI